MGDPADVNKSGITACWYLPSILGLPCNLCQITKACYVTVWLGLYNYVVCICIMLDIAVFNTSFMYTVHFYAEGRSQGAYCNCAVCPSISLLQAFLVTH